jgi:hypothetical protein
MKRLRMATLAWVLIAGGAASAQGDLRSGLLGEYFDLNDLGSFDTFPDVSKRKPTFRRIDAQINVASTSGEWPETKLVDHFYIRWTGIINLVKGGKYTFYTESDDGSRLYIDGKLVVDNGGLHGMTEKEGEIELKGGDHEIKVEMFENEGDAGCRVSYAGPGVEKQVIPDIAFYHKMDKDLDKK